MINFRKLRKKHITTHHKTSINRKVNSLVLQELDSFRYIINRFVKKKTNIFQPSKVWEDRRYYEPGDEINHIDWKKSVSTGGVVIKNFSIDLAETMKHKRLLLKIERSESEFSVVILMDITDSMYLRSCYLNSIEEIPLVYTKTFTAKLMAAFFCSLATESGYNTAGIAHGQMLFSGQSGLSSQKSRELPRKFLNWMDICRIDDYQNSKKDSISHTDFLNKVRKEFRSDGYLIWITENQ